MFVGRESHWIRIVHEKQSSVSQRSSIKRKSLPSPNVRILAVRVKAVPDPGFSRGDATLPIQAADGSRNAMLGVKFGEMNLCHGSVLRQTSIPTVFRRSVWVELRTSFGAMHLCLLP